VTAERPSEAQEKLWRCADQDDVAGAKEAIAQGASPLAGDEEGRTALMRAAQMGKKAVALFLLPKSDLFARDRHGGAALRHTISRSDVELIEAIAKASSMRIRRECMFSAAWTGKTAALLTLLAIEGDVPDERGRTVLMMAARHNHKETVEALLKNNASDPRRRAPGGMNAFDWAARSDHWACADMLSQWAAPKALRAALAEAGAEWMPQAAARLEAKELAWTLAGGKPRDGQQGGQGRERARAGAATAAAGHETSDPKSGQPTEREDTREGPPQSEPKSIKPRRM
jgi:hypothetical protein